MRSVPCERCGAMTLMEILFGSSVEDMWADDTVDTMCVRCSQVTAYRGHDWEPYPTLRVHRTFRCRRCGVILSGMTERDVITSGTDGLGRCSG